jgi:HEAT repeat protein
MLALAPRRYLPVVAAELAKGEEAAAIALGESRQPEALPALKDALETGGAEMQETVLLGIALLRSEAANAFLVELVRDAPEGRAIAAAHALALHRHDARLVARVREAAAPRRSRKLAKAIEDKFGKESGER